LHKEEGTAFMELERAHLEQLGMSPDGGGVPVHQDPGFIVAADTGAEAPLPAIPALIERREI